MMQPQPQHWENHPRPAAPPTDSEVKKRIDKTAEYVNKNGPQFEGLMQEKQRNNPEYEFLFGGEHAEYYRFMLYCLRNNIPPDQHFVPAGGQYTGPYGAGGAPDDRGAYPSGLDPAVQDDQRYLQPPGAEPEGGPGLSGGDQPPAGPLTVQRPSPETMAELHQLVDHLSGEKDAIKNAKAWFVSRPTEVYVLAHALVDAVCNQPPPRGGFQKRLYAIYVANDVLFHGLKHRPPGQYTDPFSTALLPLLGPLLSSAYHHDDADASGSRLQLGQIVQFWGERGVFNGQTVTMLANAMLDPSARLPPLQSMDGPPPAAGSNGVDSANAANGGPAPVGVVPPGQPAMAGAVPPVIGGGAPVDAHGMMNHPMHPQHMYRQGEAGAIGDVGQPQQQQPRQQQPWQEPQWEHPPGAAPPAQQQPGYPDGYAPHPQHPQQQVAMQQPPHQYPGMHPHAPPPHYAAHQPMYPGQAYPHPQGPWPMQHDGGYHPPPQDAYGHPHAGPPPMYHHPGAPGPMAYGAGPIGGQPPPQHMPPQYHQPPPFDPQFGYPSMDGPQGHGFDPQFGGHGPPPPALHEPAGLPAAVHERFPRFPPGLVPAIITSMLSVGMPPYAAIKLADVPTSLPPSGLTDAYLRQRIDQFYADVDKAHGTADEDTENEEARPVGAAGVPGMGVPGGMTAAVQEARKAASDEDSDEEPMGLGFGPTPNLSAINPDTNTLIDGSVQERPGVKVPMYLGLGAKADPTERDDLDDMYSSYRKQRSSTYHQFMGQRGDRSAGGKGGVKVSG
eukprot:jgi/Mesvir1/325/Mv22733-RA.1